MTASNLWARRPLLDLASYGRWGPTRRDSLTAAEVAQISRTLNRHPEVMVKVLTHGPQDARGIGRHLDYISREGEVDVVTDDGRRLEGANEVDDLVSDWDLDLEELRRRPSLDAREPRRPPKLVHKLIFSMPPGTPPDKVFAAVRTFAREEFALQHRYAMALHTDEAHPHVHLVVKALGENGKRLNIKKATLRAWRADFAAQLRAQGVAANATERAARGQGRRAPRDGKYRALQRGTSLNFRRGAFDGPEPEPPLRVNHMTPDATRPQTRQTIVAGWRQVQRLLEDGGYVQLADRADRMAYEINHSHPRLTRQINPETRQPDRIRREALER